VVVFYLLIAFEFFYMASPFAVYFYSVYGPGLNFINNSRVLVWLSSTFLPHIVSETSSVLLDLLSVVGAILAAIGVLAFGVGAGQVYYHKLARKGAVTGGVYNIIRHPQYASLALCSFGLLLLWPRYIVLVSFVTMLFAYYFLAKAEERECEEKFGLSYVEYKRQTSMFLPFRLPLADKLPCLPHSGLTRYLSVLGLWMVTCGLGVGLATGLRGLALDSLYGLYTQDAAYVSVGKAEQDRLVRIVAIAMADSDLQNLLTGNQKGSGEKFINYVLPSTWYVSEIPMKVVEGVTHGHHYPADYDETLYRIVFTRAELRAGQQAEGRDILLNAQARTPVVEVVVDLAQNKVIGIELPGETIKYEDVPVPVY
jgi:protein-S-isoprenylcysteine O-methyltransferase Ste14